MDLAFGRLNHSTVTPTARLVVHLVHVFVVVRMGSLEDIEVVDGAVVVHGVQGVLLSWDHFDTEHVGVR